MRAWSAPAARSASACAPSSAGANAFWVMGTVRIAVKAAAAMFLIVSRPRNVSGFCSPAINPSTPRCHRIRSCRIWLTRGSLSVQRAASTGSSATMTRCTGVVAPGSRRSPERFHGCGPQVRIRCGAGTSPICPPLCVGSGCISTW